ncbi:hypothetical protein [Haladaptatus cibarius]|uniref:hypothetical protein n=1 Tax=Haladaptatus cibarius TaxID=453847 RepID=UPI000678D95D|nr:hypothetical protein [Haladaptatus cibarius]
MSVAIDNDTTCTVDKDAFDAEFEAIDAPEENELGHTRTATASCYLPCHTASKLPCCDTTN